MINESKQKRKRNNKNISEPYKLKEEFPDFSLKTIYTAFNKYNKDIDKTREHFKSSILHRRNTIRINDIIKKFNSNSNTVRGYINRTFNKSVAELDDEDFKSIEEYFEKRKRSHENAIKLKELAKEFNITSQAIMTLRTRLFRKIEGSHINSIPLEEITDKDIEKIRKYLETKKRKTCKPFSTPIKFDISPYKTVNMLYKEEYSQYVRRPLFNSFYNNANTEEEFYSTINKYINEKKKYIEKERIVNEKLEVLCEKYNISRLHIMMVLRYINKTKTYGKKDLIKRPELLDLLEQYLKTKYKSKEERKANK